MKLWVYVPRNRPPEIHTRRETVIADMEADGAFDYAKEGDVDWWIKDDSVFVDDAGRADLVEVTE